MEFYSLQTLKQKESNWECSDSSSPLDQQALQTTESDLANCGESLKGAADSIKQRTTSVVYEPTLYNNHRNERLNGLSFEEACIVLPYYQIGKVDLRRINPGPYALCIFLASSWISGNLDFGFEYHSRIYTMDEAASNTELSNYVRQYIPIQHFMFKFIGSFDDVAKCDLANAIRTSPGLIQYPKGFYSLVGVFSEPVMNNNVLSYALAYNYSVLNGLVKRKFMTKRPRLFSTKYQFLPGIIPILTCLMLHVRTILLSNFSSSQSDKDPELNEVDCELYKLAALYSTAYMSKLPFDYDATFRIPRRNKTRLAERKHMLAGMSMSLWKSPMLKLQPEDMPVRDIIGSALLAEAMGFAIRLSNGMM